MARDCHQVRTERKTRPLGCTLRCSKIVQQQFFDMRVAASRAPARAVTKNCDLPGCVVQRPESPPARPAHTISPTSPTTICSKLTLIAGIFPISTLRMCDVSALSIFVAPMPHVGASVAPRDEIHDAVLSND